jgi:hypothetical protein
MTTLAKLSSFYCRNEMHKAINKIIFSHTENNKLLQCRGKRNAKLIPMLESLHINIYCKYYEMILMA